jgi:hypothetical protein
MERYHFDGDDSKIREYLSYLQRELEPFELFQSCILGNMLTTQATMKERVTPLTMLNQGPETSVAYKRRIAEYLGVPTGKWLCQLQAALRNTRNAIGDYELTC